jgi:hypothetical protein
MDCVEDTVHCCIPIISLGTGLFVKALLITAVYTCLLRICSLAADVVSLFFPRSLPSNGSICYSIMSFVMPAMALYFPGSDLHHENSAH